MPESTTNPHEIAARWKEILIPAKAVHTVRNIGKTESQWLYGYKERPIA